MLSTETINLSVKLRGMKHSGGLDLLIEENLTALHQLLTISSARVVLERQQEVTPSFCVFAYLTVTGPDIHASARDHTLLAAWHKLAENLKKQIDRRIMQHQRRHKDSGQCRSLASQWNRGA